MGIKLLLADDSITIQKVIGIIFGGEDYSLTVVDNGKAAVEKARELCPDVLLIDALMPGMSGYEVCEAVRAIPELATKPILILTGSFEPFDEDKAKKCGADDYLAKPFESQQIVNKVKELAELGASRAVQTLTAEPLQSSAAPEPSEPFVAPLETIDVPLSAPPSAVSQSAEASDIWGAFTPEAEPATAPEAPQNPVEPQLSELPEPDVFAIVNEEYDSQIVQSSAPSPASPQHTGTQWIPVEEHTFEFEEESVATLPETIFSERSVTEHDSGFGEIAFEDEIPAKAENTPAGNIEPELSDSIVPQPEIASFTEAVPSFEPLTDITEVPTTAIEPTIDIIETPAPTFSIPNAGFVEPEMAPVAMPAPTTSASAAVTLSEEQLKAAISSASKEVIERIVWEVVPDLAEIMIREAIRKIKEGI